MTYAVDNRPAKGSALYARKMIEHLMENSDHEYYLVHYDLSCDSIYGLGAKEIIMPHVRLPFATRLVRQWLFYWKYRNEKFDLIHWFQPRLYPFYWLAPANHKVVTAHGAGDITAPGSFSFGRLMFNIVLRHANFGLSAIIGDSNFARDEIIEFYRTNPKKTHSIPLGGAEDFTPLQPGFRITQCLAKYSIDKPYILSISRHVKHKNIGRLISAYDILRTRYPERQELLVIVGARSLSYEENRKRRDASMYARDIKFIEFIEPADLNALYSGATVMAFPSLNEGFGLPVIEAFASGVPVITAVTTAVGEVAADAAVTVDPQNVSELAEALHRVLSDAPLQDELIAKGLVRAASFTWEETAQQTLCLYDELFRSA